MNEILKNLIQVLKDMVLAIDKHQLSEAEAKTYLIQVIAMTDSAMKLQEPLMQDKLDFLIFMASKRTTMAGKEVILSGEQLFQQWRKARDKSAKNDYKPIPDENAESK